MFTRSILAGDRGGQIMLALLLAVTAGVTFANQFLPTDHALHVPTYTVTLLGKYLCYALLAVAVDLAWGYLGILSLGHGAFFALGGYAMGMYLMRQIGTRGVRLLKADGAVSLPEKILQQGLVFRATEQRIHSDMPGRPAGNQCAFPAGRNGEKATGPP